MAERKGAAMPVHEVPPQVACLLESLDHWAETTPDALAVDTQSNGRLTYAELKRKAERLASGLASLGLKPGDRIAIQLPSYPEFIVAYMAACMMGGVLTTLHMPYRREELIPLMRFARARAVICAPVGAYDAPATMLSLKGEVATLEHVIVVAPETREGCQGFDALIEAGGAPPSDRPSPDAPCTLCFTSGTSAAPKGVIRSQRKMAENAIRYTPMIRMTGKDRVMIAPPFTHVFGLLCAGNAILTGAAILPVPVFTPDTYADILLKLEPTVIYSAPAHLAATLKSGVLDARPPASVRDVIVGGSICPPEVARAFEDKLPNGRVGCLFGMTEVLLATQTDIEDEPSIRHGTVGRLVPGLEWRVADGEGRQADRAEGGELQLRGYSVLEEYAGNPDANAASFTQDGWFRTGDLATVDAAGNITITGRVKDLINRGGVKINPSDIESLLDAHERILQSAIVPMPDEVLGERICLYATLTPGPALTLREVCAYLERQGIAKMRWPERLEIVEAMPQTPTRKIIKSVLVDDIRKKLSA